MKWFILSTALFFICCTDMHRIGETYEIRSTLECPRGDCYLSISARTPIMDYNRWVEIYKADSQEDAELWVSENINTKDDIQWKVDSASRSNGVYKQFKK